MNAIIFYMFSMLGAFLFSQGVDNETMTRRKRGLLGVAFSAVVVFPMWNALIGWLATTNEGHYRHDAPKHRLDGGHAFRWPVHYLHLLWDCIFHSAVCSDVHDVAVYK